MKKEACFEDGSVRSDCICSPGFYLFNGECQPEEICSKQGWSYWSNWSECDDPCQFNSSGKQDRTRICLGENCPKSAEIETTDCIGTCDASEWRLIYSQTHPSNFAKKYCKVDDCYYQDDQGNYINFDGLTGWSEYHFKFEWDGEQTMSWTQKSNPLTIKNADASPFNIEFSDPKLSTQAVSKYFKGLSLSSGWVR